MISILMSTYNGAAYIAEQLDSIIAQSVQDWELIVRDDGSTDGTQEILREYEKKDVRIRVVEDTERRGAMRGFEWLLERYGAGEYVAFADQDDVWLPDKLRVCMETMLKSEQQYGSDTPIVVHTDLVVVDSTLHIVAKSFWEYTFIKPDVLNRRAEYLAICNSVTGCTMLMNQAARRVSLPLGERALMHDAAIAISTMLNHGRVVPVYVQTMWYRQHGDNVAGAVAYKWMIPLRAKYNNARRQYEAYHPEVFSNVLCFLYWKVRCFLEERLWLCGIAERRRNG